MRGPDASPLRVSRQDAEQVDEAAEPRRVVREYEVNGTPRRAVEPDAPLAPGVRERLLPHLDASARATTRWHGQLHEAAEGEVSSGP